MDMIKPQFDIIPFESRDGFSCNLWHLQTTGRPIKGPVLLVHAAGMRANSFNPPHPHNLINMLAEAGYDVWLENWRASIDFEPNQWDLDQAAFNDHPAAVERVMELTGADTLKVIANDQGSSSFMISAVMGLVPQVSTLICNGLSLHPVMPYLSAFKLYTLMPLVARIKDYIMPESGVEAPVGQNRLNGRYQPAVPQISEPRDEIDKLATLPYGSAFPSVSELKNLDKATEHWLKKEFGPLPVSFLRHLRKCIDQNCLVPNHTSEKLPETYAAMEPKTKARFILYSSEKNDCFTADGQANTFGFLNAFTPGLHKLRHLPGYGHLDVFFGKNAHQDVFPKILKDLELD